MISLLVSLLILCLIAGLIWFVIGQLPLPQPWRAVVMAIVALIFVIYLLHMLPVGAADPVLR